MINFVNLKSVIDEGASVGELVEVEDAFSHIRSDIKGQIQVLDEITDNMTTNTEGIKKSNEKIKIVVDPNQNLYSCTKCDYTAKQQCSLKNHVMSKHQKIRFPCQVCDYKGTTKGNTNMHMNRKHSM